MNEHAEFGVLKPGARGLIGAQVLAMNESERAAREV
jgi:hypothetical protein